MNISIFGTGYVGLVTGACLANLGHNVICCDIDEKKIQLLKAGKIPFHEPNLPAVVQATTHKGNLSFTTNTQQTVQHGKVIFNCVGTPSNGDGSANLQFIHSVVDAVAQYAEQDTVLVNKSTVPPGTARKTQQLLREKNSHVKIAVVSNPEFLKEGNAVHDFTHPDKIVIGAQSEHAFQVMGQVYSGLLRPYLNTLETDWETAEMIKYANNSFLATKISFINEIANICDKIGADVKKVAQGLGMDYRISSKFLNAGIGYGGSCFPKDVRALVQTAKEHGYTASLLQEVDELNKRQKKGIIHKVKNVLGDDLSGQLISIWGLSFKPKTNDIREASSLVIINGLLECGANLVVYDPVAMDEIKTLYSDRIKYAETLEQSTLGTSAIILITEWDEFRNVNFENLASGMKQKILFDGRNIYEPEIIRKAGFIYYGMGRNK